MQQIIIGSTAAKHWLKDFRNPNDLDIVSKDFSLKKPGVEVHYSSAFDYLLNQDKPYAYANLDELYTIKVSHSFWNIKHDKTMHDIEIFQQAGAKLIEPFYSLLYKDWEVIHGKKKVNLNQYNEDFFTKNVERKFDHDFLHENIKYYDRPFYQQLKFDQSKALIEKSLFDALSDENKIRCVKEECCVIALERYVIPNNFKQNSHIAYRKAMIDLLTSLTKGWFAKFISENYHVLKKFEDIDKYKTFIKNNCQ